jgi:hypothetical protein
MPELLADKSAGVLVDSIDAAVDAVAVAASLDRAEVRRQAVLRFGVDRMVDEYLAVYQQVLRATRARL